MESPPLGGFFFVRALNMLDTPIKHVHNLPVATNNSREPAMQTAAAPERTGAADMKEAASAMKIEKGIPMPKDGRGAAKKYPFDRMQVSDSFVVPVVGREPGRVQATVAASAVVWARRYNPSAKFATRQIDKTAVRIWRIA